MNAIQTIQRLQEELSCGDVVFSKVHEQRHPQTGQVVQEEGAAIVINQRIFCKGPNVAPTEARIVQIGKDYAALLNEAVAMAEHFHDMAMKEPQNVSRLNGQ